MINRSNIYVANLEYPKRQDTSGRNGFMKREKPDLKKNPEIRPITIKLTQTQLMTSKTSEVVRAVMTGLFKKYGLPKAIHSDNGAEFAAPNGLLNLTCLSTWWITLGIMPDRSLKGCPGQNGSLERMHADIAREIEGKVPGGIRANQRSVQYNYWTLKFKI